MNKLLLILLFFPIIGFSQSNFFWSHTGAVTTVTIPTVVYTSTTNITENSVTMNGEVTNNGNATVTVKGFVYSSTSGVNLSNGTTVTDGSGGTGSYSFSVSSLTSNTTYYVKAYAINTEGTAYSSEYSFTTDEEFSVITHTPSNIGSSVATLGGTIEAGEALNITDYGITVNEGQNPERGELRTFSYPFNWDTMPTTFPYNYSMEVLNFDPATTYYVRAWVYDGTTVYYGSEKTFTTN